MVRAYQTHVPLQALTTLTLVTVYILSVARAVTVPFQPFIYFRF